MTLFASAYIWDGLVEDPTLPTSLTSVAAIVIFGGGPDRPQASADPW